MWPDPACLQVMREVRIMKGLDHPNIVKLYEVIDTKEYLYLVLEYAAGGEVRSPHSLGGTSLLGIGIRRQIDGEKCRMQCSRAPVYGVNT